jgi:Tol biopolymer transport system component
VKVLVGAAFGLATVLIAKAELSGQESKPSVAAPGRKVGEEAASKGVRQLVDQLKRHPAQPAKRPDRRGVYVMDLARGDVTMIADEPDPGANYCGSPRWSHDGKRILYDVMPEMEFHLLHIKAIDLGEDAPRLTDLGPGARPTFSPDDKRIAFLLHHNAVPGAEPGIWVMQADGSGRHLAGEFGMPLWSPDGRQFLVVGFDDPREVKLMDLDRSEFHPVVIPGHEIFAWPSWADVKTVAAIIGSDGSGDAVALLDVSDPERTKVKAVLWRRGKDLDVKPLWPVYSASTRRYIFVGAEPGGQALYTVEPGRARRLEAGGLDAQVGGLAFSPDGRYLLFCSTRRDRK